MDNAETIRAAVQAVLDAHGDGWSLAQHVVIMALERHCADAGLWPPPSGPPDA